MSSGTQLGVGHANAHVAPRYSAQCRYSRSRSSARAPDPPASPSAASLAPCAIIGQCGQRGHEDASSFFSASETFRETSPRVARHVARNLRVSSTSVKASPPYRASLAMGCPARFKCARIWCVRPVRGSHATKATPRGRDERINVFICREFDVVSGIFSGARNVASTNASAAETATSANAVRASFAPFSSPEKVFDRSPSESFAHVASRVRGSYRRPTSTTAFSSRSDGPTKLSLSLSLSRPAAKVSRMCFPVARWALETSATYRLRTEWLCTSSRSLLALAASRAISSSPLTFLSSLCTGKSRPRSGRDAAIRPSTVFFRY
mmetsp:Transcript_13990/g.58886  ORF Transcript_13990/g.58886 Transcript_13990/m.58886 type:complete len:322 (+) Transcript_13990:1267-2232(+)